MNPATPPSARHSHFLDLPRPYLLRHTPRPVVRHWAERVWSLYPPIALLIGAVALAGCQGGSNSQSAAAPRPADQGVIASAEAPETPAKEVFASYPADMPLAGTAAARATIRYGKNRVELANLSKLPWNEARIWINGKYSAKLPYTRAGEIRSIHFSFLRDAEGGSFSTDNSKVHIEKVELVTGDERAHVRFGLGY